MNEIKELKAAYFNACSAFLDADQAVNKSRDAFSVAADYLGAARDAFSAADNAMVEAVANRNSVRTRMYSVARALDRAIDYKKD